MKHEIVPTVGSYPDSFCGQLYHYAGVPEKFSSTDILERFRRADQQLVDLQPGKHKTFQASAKKDQPKKFVGLGGSLGIRCRCFPASKDENGNTLVILTPIFLYQMLVAEVSPFHHYTLPWEELAAGFKLGPFWNATYLNACPCFPEQNPRNSLRRTSVRSKKFSIALLNLK